MNYWLMKSEPDVFGWDHLWKMPGRTAPWDGVRNYRARNVLREMRRGDRALFHHSSCNPPHLAGIMEIVREAYPDPTQFDPAQKYYDPRSKPDRPRWTAVDVRAERKLERSIPLGELREVPGLESMLLLRRGMRLSVQPVAEEEWRIILDLARAPHDA